MLLRIAATLDRQVDKQVRAARRLWGEWPRCVASRPAVLEIYVERIEQEFP